MNRIDPRTDGLAVTTADTERADSVFGTLNRRSREVMRRLVETYMETGEPVGSRTISRLAGMGLSPATIRNVMADLEEAGLLYAPHTSAGRLPTDLGMRLFVHGLLEIGRLSENERTEIETQLAGSGQTMDGLLDQATQSLSGLSRQAGLVIAPKSENPLKHIEFVRLSPGRALVVLVMENGVIENRLLDMPPGITASQLVEAGNFLTGRLAGRTFQEARDEILAELEAHKAHIDSLTGKLVEEGLASWAGAGGPAQGLLLVHGQSRLLEDVTAIEDLERARRLFETLETKENLLRLLDLARDAAGVQIFIGSENQLFSHAGWSMIISPYRNTSQKVVGAVGVIGPMRMNYARIVPMVDYTAQVIGRLML